jgi:hypothetical protein
VPCARVDSRLLCRARGSGRVGGGWGAEDLQVGEWDEGRGQRLGVCASIRAVLRLTNCEGRILSTYLTSPVNRLRSRRYRGHWYYHRTRGKMSVE